MSEQQVDSQEKLVDDPKTEQQESPHYRVTVTDESIVAAKAALARMGYPDDLYKVTIAKDTYLIRPLIIRDWIEVKSFIQSDSPNLYNDAFLERVCQKAVIVPDIAGNPILWGLQKAGVQMTLARHILARSGFLDQEMDQSDYMDIEFITADSPHRAPTPEETEQVKAANPGVPLSRVLVCNRHFIIKPITRIQWKTVRANAKTEADAEMKISEVGCVWSEDYPQTPNFDEALAGIPTVLSSIICNQSGFGSKA